MFLKGIYAGKPAIFQLTVLLLLILAGAVFSSLIVMGFFYMIYGLHADITQYSDMMRLLQLISATIRKNICRSGKCLKDTYCFSHFSVYF